MKKIDTVVPARQCGNSESQAELVLQLFLTMLLLVHLSTNGSANSFPYF